MSELPRCLWGVPPPARFGVKSSSLTFHLAQAERSHHQLLLFSWRKSTLDFVSFLIFWISFFSCRSIFSFHCFLLSSFLFLNPVRNSFRAFSSNTTCGQTVYKFMPIFFLSFLHLCFGFLVYCLPRNSFFSAHFARFWKVGSSKSKPMAMMTKILFLFFLVNDQHATRCAIQTPGTVC